MYDLKKIQKNTRAIQDAFLFEPIGVVREEIYRRKYELNALEELLKIREVLEEKNEKYLAPDEEEVQDEKYISYDNPFASFTDHEKTFGFTAVAPPSRK